MNKLFKLLCFAITVFSFLMSTCRCVEENKKLKILCLFPHPGKSHFDFFEPLLNELAIRGHELTVLSHFPRKENISNYKDISLTEPWGIFVNVVDLKALDHSIFYVIYEIMSIRRMADIACEAMYKKPAVLELINSNEKFDLILTEVFNTDCTLGFVHKFKAPFIGLSSHQLVPWADYRMNNPDNPSYISNVFSHYPPTMNFIERVGNTLSLVASHLTFEFDINRPTQTLVENVFGPGVPPLREISKNTSVLLVNTHFSLHGARPHSVGVVEIGGLHIRPNKTLPKDIKDFLDSAEHGVLYFNWGSMVKASTVPTDKLTDIVKVFGNLKQKVLWKWENENLPIPTPKNLMLRKWLPQFDILCHPNVKAFLTHGGLLGLSEAVYAGVPMVMVPIFGDQFHNSAAAVERGIAIILNFNELNEKSLGDTLNEVLNNPSYRQNAKAVSEAYRDRPASPLETAVWWTEYVGRGKGLPFIRSSSAKLSWYQYHLLDVIAFISLVTLALIFVIVFAIKYILKTLRGEKRVKRKSNVEKNGKDKKRN